MPAADLRSEDEVAHQDADPVADEMLASAKALIAEGRIADAIARTTAALREHPVPDIERRLVRWRHDAFAQVDRSAGLPSWPPDVPDTFPGLTTTPEVSGAELSAEALGGGILHHGSLLVRGLIPPERVEQLTLGIDRAFDAYDAGRAGAPLAETLPWYAPFQPGPDYSVGAARSWVRQGGGVWTVDSPRMMFDLIETFEEARLGDVLTGYLGERPALSVKKATLRRVPITTGTDWHQDGAFLGDTIRTVNVWLSLSHCGVDAPGLDLVPRRIDGIVETGSHGAIFDWSVGPGMVDIVADGVPIESPVFEPGDALLFDQRFLHRTGIREGMTQERYAIESWFFAPSCYPLDQVPVVF